MKDREVVHHQNIPQKIRQNQNQAQAHRKTRKKKINRQITTKIQKLKDREVAHHQSIQNQAQACQLNCLRKCKKNRQKVEAVGKAVTETEVKRNGSNKKKNPSNRKRIKYHHLPNALGYQASKQKQQPSEKVKSQIAKQQNLITLPAQTQIRNQILILNRGKEKHRNKNLPPKKVNPRPTRPKLKRTKAYPTGVKCM